jgi:Outer membrane protein beta-barrel domain
VISFFVTDSGGLIFARNCSPLTFKYITMITKLKLTHLLFFIFFITTANAQKGSWYIGGQLGYNSQTEKNTGSADVTTSSWSVAPEIGTFLQNNLQLGLAVNLGGSNAPNTSETKFSPVLYLRRFYTVSDKFSLFTGIVGNFTTGSTKVNNQSGNLSGWGLNLSLGAAYAVSKTFTAVAQYGLFGYSYEETKINGNKSSVSNVGLNVNSLGPVFNVGLYWTFKE